MSAEAGSNTSDVNRFAMIIGGLMVIGGSILIVVAVTWLLTTAPPAVSAAVVAGSATVWTSVATLIWNSRSERRQVVEQELRKQKVPVYEEFMQFWFRYLTPGMDFSSEEVQEEMSKHVNELAMKAIVWAPDSFIKKYGRFRVDYSSDNPKPSEYNYQILLDWEDILRTIRADIGHKDRDLEPFDLLSLYITGVREAKEELRELRSRQITNVVN